MLGRQGKGSADAEEKLDAVRRRMSVALTAGKITHEQAIERMAAYKKRVGQGKGSADTEEKLDDAIAKRLRAAVKAGKISEEDARARLNRMRKMLDTREPRTREGDPKTVQKAAEQRIRRADYARAEARLKAAVEAGKVSEEDARARLNRMRKMLGRQGKGSADAEEKLDAVRRRMSVALTAGKITREQASERMAAYKKRVGQGKGSADTEEKLDADAIAKRLKAAVKAGKLTEKEAKAKWEAMKKRK